MESLQYKEPDTDYSIRCIQVLNFQREMLYRTFYKKNHESQQRRMGRKVPAKMKDAICKLSNIALLNKSFNHGFIQSKSQFEIQELKDLKKIQEAERRKKAKIEALNQGYQLADIDFYNEQSLL